MSEPADRTKWGDERLESLLREFFRAEMPAELQQVPDVAAAGVVSKRSPTRERQRGLAGAAGVVTAAVAVLASAVALMVTSQPEIERSPATGGRSQEAAVAEDEGAPALGLTSQESVPVELQDRPRVEHVGTSDSGGAIEVEYPELDIRVFPIDGEKEGNRRGAEMGRAKDE